MLTMQILHSYSFLKFFEKTFIEAIKLNKPVIIDVVVEADVYPPFELAKV